MKINKRLQSHIPSLGHNNETIYITINYNTNLRTSRWYREIPDNVKNFVRDLADEGLSEWLDENLPGLRRELVNANGPITSAGASPHYSCNLESAKDIKLLDLNIENGKLKARKRGFN